MIRQLFASLTVAAAAVLASNHSQAQSLAAIEAAETAVIEAWRQTPLVFRTAVLVATSPGGFGVYDVKTDAVFAPGDPIVVYAEPVGYGWRENGDGTYTFGFDVDLILKTPDGEILAGQENFQHLELTSRARNREFMLTLTLTLDGAPPGDYVVEYRARDIASDKAGTMALPFTIAQ